MHRWGRIAVICALVITACSSDTSNGATSPGTAGPTSVDTGAVTSPAATEPAATEPAATTSTAAAPPVVASLIAADGSPMSAAQFSTVADAVLRPEGFTPASPPVDVVVPDGLVSAPVRLSLPGSAPPDGALPLLLHRNELGWWEAVPADYVNGSYSADVVSFSWYWPGWAATATDWISTTAGRAVDAAGNIVDAGLDWVTGRTDPPQPCGSDPYPWVSSSGSPPDGAFHVCLEQNPRGDGTERVEVRIKSNRAFAMWVVIPRVGADYVWVEGSSWDAIGPTMLAFTGGAGDRVLLGAGRTVTVGYTQPASTPVSNRFYAYQDNLTQVMSLMTRNAGDANAAVGTLLAVISCVDEGMSSISDLSWDRAWSCLTGFLDATANQVELALDRAISSGRVALSGADREAFGAAVLRSNRLSTTLAAFKKVSAVLSLARLAADAVVLANDAAIGLVDGAGELTIGLDAAAALGLHGNGFGAAEFGDEAEGAFAYLAGVLGPPTDDSGWYETGYDPNSQDDQCQSPYMRQVSWGNLTTIYADYDPATGPILQRNFVAYYYYLDEQGADALGLATDRGLHLGDSSADVPAMYPAATVESYGFYEVDGIFGYFSQAGTVQQLTAGTEMCPA